LGVDTGIHFVGLALTDLNFKVNKNFKLPKDGIPVEIDVRTKKSFASDRKTLDFTLSVILFQKTKNKPFAMRVSVAGTFKGDDPKELEKFSKIHAPAHLFPFVREIIGTTTMRANIPPLLLPPFNLAAMLSEKKRPAE
jgi:preprotein translocase subunit SecB